LLCIKPKVEKTINIAVFTALLNPSTQAVSIIKLESFRIDTKPFRDYVSRNISALPQWGEKL